jgi:hypothetical protein
MKNTKNQKPKTKQISNTQYPTSRQGNGDSSSDWRLKDEPAKNEGGCHPFCPALAEEARTLYREATELIRILAAMCRK